MGTSTSGDKSQKDNSHNKKPSTHFIVLGTGSVGKSTICKSILLSYHKDYDKYIKRQYSLKNVETEYYNEMIEQLRINCIKQMEWLLSHRSTYGYWEEPSQNRSKDSDEMKQDTHLINNSMKSFKRMKQDQLIEYGQALSRLWNQEYINNLYKARTQRKGYVSIVREGRDGRYWFDGMGYWFDKIKTVMTTEYSRNIEDYLRIHTKPAKINEHYGNICHDHTYEVQDNAYTIKDVDGVWSQWEVDVKIKSDCNCVLYVCALNHYAHGRPGSGNGLLMSLKGIKDVMEQFVQPCKGKMVVLLNKVDIFKRFLYYTPLTYCFEQEYKGKNYNDYGWKQSGRIMQRICEELLVVGNGCKLKNIISDDVADIICMYCHLRNKYWLDLVCNYGIEFVKGKVLEIDPNIGVYVTNATDMDQIKNIMEEVHSKLQLSKTEQGN